MPNQIVAMINKAITARERLLTVIALLFALGCQYIARTTFR